MATRESNSRPDDDTEERDDAVIGQAFWRSLALIAVVAVGGGLVAWRLGLKSPPPPPREAKLALPSGREKPKVVMPAMPFTDITAAAGIDFVHENGAAGEKLLPETMGGGCAFFDHDGDGDQDLLLVQGARWPWDEREAPQPPPTMKLYDNDGTGKFRDRPGVHRPNGQFRHGSSMPIGSLGYRQPAGATMPPKLRRSAGNRRPARTACRGAHLRGEASHPSTAAPPAVTEVFPSFFRTTMKKVRRMDRPRRPFHTGFRDDPPWSAPPPIPRPPQPFGRPPTTALPQSTSS